MSKAALGTRHSAFGHSRALSTQQSAFSQTAYFGMVGGGTNSTSGVDWSKRRQPAVVPQQSLPAERRMPSAECRFSSPHIANHFTVTSVTHAGLADSVLIGVGRLVLAQGGFLQLTARGPRGRVHCAFQGGTCIQ